MNVTARHLPVRFRRQRGVVLVVSLLMLLVLTLIGLAATRSTAIEQRMTANQNDRAVAIQAAEATLRDGESLLNSAGLPNFALNTAGAYTATTMTVDWKTIDWDDPAATIAYEGGLQPSPQVAPRYFVVLTTTTVDSAGSSLSADAAETSKLVYYVYARSIGLRSDITLSDSSAVVLESAYAR
ncbi:MAG TPA: PilX N-terminal domain-containing pilus assembly protein [Gammaproteobacteria bacterium]